MFIIHIYHPYSYHYFFHAWVLVLFWDVLGMFSQETFGSIPWSIWVTKTKKLGVVNLQKSQGQTTVWMYKISIKTRLKMGYIYIYLPYQLVQDFFSINSISVFMKISDITKKMDGALRPGGSSQLVSSKTCLKTHKVRPVGRGPTTWSLRGVPTITWLWTTYPNGDDPRTVGVGKIRG